MEKKWVVYMLECKDGSLYTGITDRLQHRLAAHRAGIRKVLLPRENEPDIAEIPEAVRNEMEFVLLDTVNDALKEVLVRKTGKQQ